jgi:hypothetical protein
VYRRALVAPHDDFQEIFGRGVRQLAHTQVIDDQQRDRSEIGEIRFAVPSRSPDKRTRTVHHDLIGGGVDVREVRDSFTLSAEMDSRSALDNPGVAHLIRTVVSRFQRAGAVVNPSSWYKAFEGSVGIRAQYGGFVGGRFDGAYARLSAALKATMPKAAFEEIYAEVAYMNLLQAHLVREDQRAGAAEVFVEEERTIVARTAPRRCRRSRGTRAR